MGTNRRYCSTTCIQASQVSRFKSIKAVLDDREKSRPAKVPRSISSCDQLLGSGEYIAEFPGETVAGHFGLAIKDYTHSTAPNRRYPDLITQRLL